LPPDLFSLRGLWKVHRATCLPRAGAEHLCALSNMETIRTDCSDLGDLKGDYSEDLAVDGRDNTRLNLWKMFKSFITCTPHQILETEMRTKFWSENL